MANPIILNNVNDESIPKMVIASIIWEGATSVGDTVELKHRDAAQTLIWAARTGVTNTYLGVSFGVRGLAAPDGFKVTTLGSGRLLIYLLDY